MASSRPIRSNDQSPSAEQDHPPAYTALPAAVAASSSKERSPTTVVQQQAEGPGSQPPPTYTDIYGLLDFSEDGVDTKATIGNDGRINININQKSRRLTSLLAPVLQAQYQEGLATPRAPISHEIPEFVRNIPPINILIQIIGSRGDVQPFIALGKVLRETHHHRVRVATHPVFKDFVEENGLEFFSLGGDPAELMAFMVKNPGLIPGMESLKAGDVTKRRKGMWEMLLGGWRACIEQGNGMSYTPTPDAQQGNNVPSKPFVADAIIANPPSFGHIHCAERLGVPLHLMFTMPWSPTSAFPHPLANIQSSNAESAVTNFLSYTLVDMMTWQGLGDLVNKFRERTLGLDPISTMWAPGLISRLKVPHTYCWSPALIPKPHDWPSQVNISGFYFLSLASSYQPPPDLERFLSSGPPPVYIGFGSIVVDDPNGLTSKILEAVSLVGCRALVSKGWGGIGADDLNLPDNVMLLGNCPHDWLFPRCAAVVHHGGAGTTAAGISCGKPTVIVPFFGDQPFWGAMVAKAGAGPDPIPHKHLTAHNLAESIQTALSSEVQAKAMTLGESIRHETGSETGAKGFLSTLELSGCDLLPDRVAVWKVKGTGIKLSALAANALLEAEAIEGGVSALRLWLHKLWPVDEGPLEPISGGAGALMGSIGGIMMGVGDFPKELFKSGSKDKGKTVERPESSPSPASDSQSHETPSVMEKSNSPRPDSPRSPSSSSTAEVVASKKLGEKEKQSTGFKLESALEATKSVQKVVGTGIRSPMDFTLGLAQGFRNAPRLYGDEVRPQERVTGFHSGLRTAGKEFSRGLYDGVTGLVTQPIKGAKEEGAAGALKGFGKGVSGLVLKSGAGFWGLPAYAMKGVHRELVKLGAKDVEAYIVSARIAQGAHDLEEASPETKKHILQRWHEVRLQAKQRRLWERKFSPRHQFRMKGPDGDEIEKAIQTSVQSTSRGNTADDEAIERAIRASMAELLRIEESGERYDEEEALRRAIAASVAEHQAATNGSSESEKTLIPTTSQPAPLPPLPPRSPEDEELLKAIEESKRYGAKSQGTSGGDDGDEELRRAINESKRLQVLSLDSPPLDDPQLSNPGPLYYDGPHHWQGSSESRSHGSPPKVPAKGRSALNSDPEESLEEDEQLRRAIEESRHSASSAYNPRLEPAPPPGDDRHNSLRRAIEESRQQQGAAPYVQPTGDLSRRGPPATIAENDDEDLNMAMAESLRLESETKKKREEEERVLMEYVVKASLEEEEKRRRLEEKRAEGLERGLRDLLGHDGEGSSDSAAQPPEGEEA